MTGIEPLAVDVVIPAYNAARWIADTVKSALGQRGVMPRVVVVDDGSSDGTLDVVARFVPEVTVINQRNQGVSVARNLGVDHGSALYLAFLDADDLWAPDFLARQTRLLESDPELGGVLPTILALYAGAKITRVPLRRDAVT